MIADNQSRRDFMTIAQRFIAGKGADFAKVPSGRLKLAASRKSVVLLPPRFALEVASFSDSLIQAALPAGTRVIQCR